MFGDDLTLEDVMPFAFAMSFNGIDMSSYFYVQEDSGRGLMGKEVETITIPSRAGGYASRSRRPIREIHTSIIILAENAEELRKQLETLNDIFDVDEPKSMVFSDEDDRTYYGLPGGVSEGEQKLGFYKAEITFLCTDPYKYGPEKENTFTNGAITITNQGTAPTKPIFDISVKEDVTFLQLAKDTGEYMQIGYPVDVDDVVVDPTPEVIDEDMSSFDNWSTDNLLPPDNGTIAGYFVTDDYLWKPDSFGSGDGWHGPARRRDLPKLVDDYWVEVLFRFQIYDDRSNRLGILQCDLIGSNNERIGKLELKETSIHTKAVRVDIHIEGSGKKRFLLENATGYRRGSYNNFYGKLFLRKQGNYFYAQVGERMDDGKYANRMNARFTDVDGDFSEPLAGVQVRAAQYQDRMPVDQMYIHHVFVREFNNPETAEIPYIAKEGDTMTINHQNGEILINGENAEDLKDFGANYFALEKGDNSLYAFPEGAFDITVKHQDRYL